MEIWDAHTLSNTQHGSSHTHTRAHICAGGIWCARSARRRQQKKSHVNVVFENLRIWCFAGAVPNPFAFIHTWYTFTSVRNASHSCHNNNIYSVQHQHIQAHIHLYTIGNRAEPIAVDWCILYVTTCVWISCSQNGTWCQYNTQQTTQYTLFQCWTFNNSITCRMSHFPVPHSSTTIWITVDTMCRWWCVCVCATVVSVRGLAPWNGPRDHALHIYVSDARILRLEMRTNTCTHGRQIAWLRHITQNRIRQLRAHRKHTHTHSEENGCG